MIAPLALGIGRTGANRGDAVRLRTFYFIFSNRGRVEVQAHKQIRIPPVGQRRTIGQFNKSVFGAGHYYVESRPSELVAYFPRQRESIDFLVVPGRLVTGVLAAVARI